RVADWICTAVANRAPTSSCASVGLAAASARSAATTQSNNLLEPDLGRAVAAAGIGFGLIPRHKLAAPQRLAHCLSNRTGALAMHDARLGHTHQRSILQVLLEAFERLVAPLTAQVQLIRHLAAWRGNRDRG